MTTTGSSAGSSSCHGGPEKASAYTRRIPSAYAPTPSPSKTRTRTIAPSPCAARCGKDRGEGGTAGAGSGGRVRLFRQQVCREPVAGQRRDLVEGPGFLEEVGGAGDDLQPVLAVQ